MLLPDRPGEMDHACRYRTSRRRHERGRNASVWRRTGRRGAGPHRARRRGQSRARLGRRLRRRAAGGRESPARDRRPPSATSRPGRTVRSRVSPEPAAEPILGASRATFDSSIGRSQRHSPDKFATTAPVRSGLVSGQASTTAAPPSQPVSRRSSRIRAVPQGPPTQRPQRSATGSSGRASSIRPSRTSGSSGPSGARTWSDRITPPACMAALHARRPHWRFS